MSRRHYRPAPSPGPEVDTPQALREWNEDVAIGQALEDLRRPTAAELAEELGEGR